MTLEQKLKKKVVVRRTPSPQVLDAINKGNRFIVLEDDFPESAIPGGYSMIRIRYQGTELRSLVPQDLLFYMANPGEGNPDAALDSIADFYGDVGDFEDGQIEEGRTSIQEADWATTAREAYRVYLINRLVRAGSGGEGDGKEESSVEYNQETMRTLDLDDPYVAKRVKAIAAIVLGKSIDEVKQDGLEDLVRHVTIEGRGESNKISTEEFRSITSKRFVPHWDAHTKTMRCLSDSHYDLRPEFIDDPEFDYDLRTMTKTKKKVTTEYLEREVKKIEDEIRTHRTAKRGGQLGRHDDALIRQYANMTYIARKNPRAQLDIQPPGEPDAK